MKNSATTHLFSQTMVKQKTASRSPHEGWKPVSELMSTKGGKNEDLPMLTDMSIFIKSDMDSSTGGAALRSSINLAADNNKKKTAPDSGATNG